MNRRAVVPVFVAVLGLVMSACGGSGGATTVTAQFRDAAGLFVGNDVGVLGVRVGKVIRIEPVGRLVDVSLEIDPGVKVPADAGAVIVSRSVATDRYVELTPVYDGGRTLRSGATIAASRTRNPVEFDQVLATVDELAAAVAGPDGKASALQDLVAVGSDVLEGNGKRIARTVKDLGAALDAFNGGSADAAAVLDNLDELTSTLAANDRTVRAFADQATEATDLLDDDHVLLEQTFDALSAMLRKVAAFVREHRAEIGSQLDDITTLSRTLLTHQEQLSELVETMPLMMQNIDRAVDDDNRLTMKLRPTELVPGAIAAKALCGELPDRVCDGVDFSSITLFSILDRLSGVGP